MSDYKPVYVVWVYKHPGWRDAPPGGGWVEIEREYNDLYDAINEAFYYEQEGHSQWRIEKRQ